MRRLSLTLLARRSLDRAGTRHWRRGADTQVGRGGVFRLCSLVWVVLWYHDHFVACTTPASDPAFQRECCTRRTSLNFLQHAGLAGLPPSFTCVSCVLCVLHHCRQGYAANFVETEQLVTLDDGRVVASYVQVGVDRGVV